MSNHFTPDPINREEPAMTKTTLTHGEADSNLVRHARRELAIAGLDSPDSDYDGMLAAAALEIIELFARQGHSGYSAAAVVAIVQKLMQFQPLTALTDNPEDWVEVADGLWQSWRDPACFSRDGGATFTRNGERGVTHTSVPEGKLA